MALRTGCGVAVAVMEKGEDRVNYDFHRLPDMQPPPYNYPVSQLLARRILQTETPLRGV